MKWVQTALADDALVAELLLRMKHSTAAPPQLPPPPPLLAWGSRQARSKPAAALKKDRDSMMRCSPTTPLSWCYGAAASSASPSDDSGRPSDISSGSRSKGVSTKDFIACSSTNNHSKRKKSLIELQNKETLLLDERIHLKTDLETMYVTLKKQKVDRENLTRLKTDLHQQSACRVASESYNTGDLTWCQVKGEASSRNDYNPVSNNINMQYDRVVAPADSVKTERGFILPDLNMMPSEDDSAFNSLNGL